MMKRQCLIIAISFLMFACGSNAENVPKEKNPAPPVLIEEQISSTEEKKTEEISLKELGKIEEGEGIEDPDLVVEEIKVETVEKVLPTIEDIRANHDTWHGLTNKFVSPTGKVNYKLMKANSSKIKIYLLHLEKTPPQHNWSRNEKLAYWINLYNASTVYLIAGNYPVSSITKINGGKPWDKKFVKSGTKTYSLNDIENNIVRPQFKDPRIHAALNCAAISCPKLLNGAFLPASLDAQLDQQVRAWINDSSKNKLNENKVQISQIFDWYKADFTDGVVAFINKYKSNSIAIQSTTKITYLEYNWTLNE